MANYNYTPSDQIAIQQRMSEELMNQDMRQGLGRGQKTDWGRGLAHMLKQYQGGKMMSDASQQQADNTELKQSEMSQLLARTQGDLATGGTGPLDPNSSPANYSHPDVQNLSVQRAFDEADAVRDQGYAMEEAGSSDTSNIRDYNHYKSLKTPEERAAFAQMIRSDQYRDVGGSIQKVNAFPDIGSEGQGQGVVQEKPLSTLEGVLRTYGQPGGQQAVQTQTAPGGATETTGQGSTMPPSSFVKSLSPDNELSYVQDKEKVKVLGKAQGDKAVDQSTTELKLAAAFQKNGFLGKKINQARNMAGDWSTGLIGGVASQVWGTKAYDLNQHLETIKANIGFDKLQSMRESSKTGGALGNVSDRENMLLQAVWGSLQNSQSKEQFLSNLDDLETQIKSSWNMVAKAYEADYGKPFDIEGLEMWQDDDETEPSPAALRLQELRDRRK